jgi:8-oxo-dGTP pyrophosphatase MutT (NUDIX family)
MLTIHVTGRWAEGQVRSRWTASTRPIVPEVEAEIERAWAAAMSRPGIHLFDGKMCRLERWDATPEALFLTLSPTTYKTFLGTNMANRQLADRHGKSILANPAGTCVALESADGQLVLGRRNAKVAYYPDRVHPVAGALEPDDDGDPFITARRELAEELHLRPEDVTDLVCLGILEDHRLRQPELAFCARTSRRLEDIRGALDRMEHEALIGIPISVTAVEEAIADPALTPVGVGSLMLWGRERFGDEWLADTHAMRLRSWADCGTM